MTGYFSSFISHLGQFHVAVNEQGAVVRCGFRPLEMSAAFVENPVRCRAVIQELKEYFAGRSKEFSVPLAMSGTDFQKNVWETLLTIPYGATISYRELATRIGNPRAVRAVGGANGANPVAVIVPCHRVIGSNGSLTGYGGGMLVKEALLVLEARGNEAPRGPRSSGV
ncbi:MAG: methylated-DNA--[protein]-cysteine S-methyltransferase [Acidobacteriota bacterium]